MDKQAGEKRGDELSSRKK